MTDNYINDDNNPEDFSDTSHGIEDVEEFLEIAQQRFFLAAEAESKRREVALDDLNFLAGQQWDSKIMAERSASGRPCLTINQLPQYVRRITNDLRQNRPSMQASPVHEDADIETADIIQGILRHIQYDSNADIAYDTASKSAVGGGFGYFVVRTKYSDPMSFDQDIKIDRIRNPFTVYFDPACEAADYSDARYAFIVKDMTMDEFKAAYPDADVASLSSWKGEGDQTMQWVSKDTVRVAEYYLIEERSVKIGLLSDGQVFELSKIEGKLPKGVFIKQTRTTKIKTVKWYKINAKEILDHTDWLGTEIPIVPILGDELDVNGDVTYESAIRHTKDSQRMYNYWSSAQTEMVGLAPKAQWLMVEGQNEGYMNDWNSSNIDNTPVLYYKNTIKGAEVGAPVKLVNEPPIQAIAQSRQQCAEDIKSTVGMYDASLGMTKADESGKAVLLRQNQTDTSNLHFSDNVTRAIKRCGRICLEIIPHVYDGPRMMRIVTESGEHDMVQVNKEFIENGITKLYDLTTGKYDIVISAGPSYNTKRQEAAKTSMALVQAVPELMTVVGDIMVKNLDIPYAEEMSDRIKKSLPPALQDNNDDIPPQAKAMMSQQTQMIQKLTTELNAAVQKIEGKVLEAQSKERIALENNRAGIVEALIAQAGSANQAIFEGELDHISQKLDQSHQAALQDAAQAHDESQALLAQQNQPTPTQG